MSFLPLLHTTLQQLETQRKEIREKIREASGLPGICIDHFFSLQECEDILQDVYRLEPYWKKGACPGEYTVGRSFYTAIDNREVMDYFDEAPYFNQLIQQTFPTLVEKIVHFCQLLVETSEIQIRPGWAGPGIVVFQPEYGTAEDGGSCHIDYEGLSKRLLDVATGAEIFSFMLPLSLPTEGGGLNVWPEVYQRFHHNRYLNEIEDPQGDAFSISYAVGNLYGIHSLRIHQIEPFEGDIDRVIVTFHLAHLDNGWNIWF